MSNQKKNKIVQNDLKTLLRKFSDNDVISKINEEFETKTSLQLNPFLIEDNAYLKSTHIDEKKYQMTMRSIKEKGLLNPLIIRSKGDKYEVIDGRYRLVVAKKLQLANVPVIVHNFDDEDMLVYMLYVMRNSREVKPVEIALICRALSKKFHYTQQNLATIMDISRSQVANMMRLLSLPQHIIEEMNKGNLSYGHAKAIITVDKSALEGLVKKIIDENLSVRDVEKIVHNLKYDDITNNCNEMVIDEKKKTIKITYQNKLEKDMLIKVIKKIKDEIY